MGLGSCNPEPASKTRTCLQIAFIKQIVEILVGPERQKYIWTTEPYLGIPRPDPFPGTFNAVLRHLGFQVVLWDYEYVQLPLEPPYNGHAMQTTTATTLFYAPNLCSYPTLLTLWQCHPALYIGGPVDFLLARLNNDVDNPIRRFKDEYVWRLLPEYVGLKIILYSLSIRFW